MDVEVRISKIMVSKIGNGKEDMVASSRHAKAMSVPQKYCPPVPIL